jgi:plastocyanin
MFRPAAAALLLSVTLCASGGCSKQSESGTAAAAPPPAAPAATPTVGGPAGSGQIKGTVKLTGKAPERKAINMKADPYCGQKGGAKDEEVVVGASGGLKNVVIHVVQGLNGKYGPKAEDAVMDQQGCMYRPRVLVAQAGQTVVIKNSDQTMHNIHTYKGPVTLFNQAEVFGMPPIKKKFPSAGDVVKFKCDVHPWMTGYLLVTDNPFSAVSDDDGSFAIRDLPPGNYTVEAWHERLGTQKAPVTVTADKPAELKLEFAAK